jgi:AcrR family transcriptional regulator
MLARGASFQQVARAMGCSRTTLWRAYYGSQPFRVRVWWERQALNREAELRLGSLRAQVTEQIERLVSAGDPGTVRWLADRLGLFADPRPADPRQDDLRPAAPRDDSPRDDVPDDDGARWTGAAPACGDPPAARAAARAAAPATPPAPRPVPNPRSRPAPGPTVRPAPEGNDDSIPGAFRERVPPNPAIVAAILARPEGEGPKGVYPWTLNPDDPFPNLGSALERRGGRGAWSRPL